MKIKSKSEDSDKTIVKVAKKIVKKVSKKKAPAEVETPAVLPELPRPSAPVIPVAAAPRKLTIPVASINRSKEICGGHKIAVCKLRARRLNLI